MFLLRVGLRLPHPLGRPSPLPCAGRMRCADASLTLCRNQEGSNAPMPPSPSATIRKDAMRRCLPHPLPQSGRKQCADASLTLCRNQEGSDMLMPPSPSAAIRKEAMR